MALLEVAGGLWVRYAPHVLMVLAQLCYTLMYFITEAGFNQGLNPYVYITYRHLLVAVLIWPFAYYQENIIGGGVVIVGLYAAVGKGERRPRGGQHGQAAVYGADGSSGVRRGRQQRRPSRSQGWPRVRTKPSKHETPVDESVNPNVRTKPSKPDKYMY